MTQTFVLTVFTLLYEEQNLGIRPEGGVKKETN